ncbi:TBC1 domain family member 25 [Diabrotica virgifera virgifera]|uniref:Rab-GAP TBC domain-containing protein n=1 Tax=Diabrotica virgifera virgifera TaxID=50390 RepID=A0ABM5IXZ9_DIAVI|nr:TBC1 domain family member 25 [Diabrotica virgifera virgifera]
MSGVFGYSREAVRVKVKKCERNQPPEMRKFSVDPQITSFEVLQSILAKAFDLKGDFTVCFRIYDVNGYETYMPILSDWDLDAAFLKAHNASVASNSEPCLSLRVDLKPFEESSDDWEIKQNVPIITQIRTVTSQEAKPAPRLHGIFNQVGKTLNLVQRAFNFGEDGNTTLQPPRPPLSDAEFRRFLDPVGQIMYAKELRSVIYFGGIEPSLRKVVWKHLLNVYPSGMTGKERMDYIKKKASEYVNLKETWKTAIAQGQVAGELAYTTGMVRKDVLRTDRHHPFYAGSDDNQNIASLFNILTTYALNHPKVSYCQGMSDLASPLLVTMNDEAHAYICFCALMQRLCTNFMIDGIAMTQKFTHLAEGILYYDPEFYNYLKIHQADDLLFCYRWLLLEMKREFAFEDSLRMLEVLWSSLPADPPDKELKLFDTMFQPTISTPPISPLVKTPRENAYTKIIALRRQSSSMSLSSYNSKKTQQVKRQNHSLDESVSKTKAISVVKTKYQSLDDAVLQKPGEISPKSPKNCDFSPKNLDFSPKNSDSSPKTSEISNCSLRSELRPRSISPLEQKSDSVVLNNRINAHQMLSRKSTSLSSSMTNLIKNSKRTGHFKDLKEKLFSSLDRLDATHSIKEEEESRPYQGRLVKNLNEFLNLSTVSKLETSEKPKIMLTKSSLDDSESSSISRHYSSTSNSGDDTSPDDSQEYFPLTTSVTRELRLELENLDRKVFGDKFVDRLSESPASENDSTVTKEVELKDKRKSDDVFLWENPLHQKTPSVSKLNTHTPDEQADIDFDAPEAVTTPEAQPDPEDATDEVDSKPLTTELPTSNGTVPAMTNSCEEVTESVKTSSLLPSPNEFGGGNPFLMFLCITLLMQHRDHIMGKAMDYNEMAMHFDKMVRKHNVTRVLNQARQMYARYMKQHSIAQQRVEKNEDC